MRNTIFSSTLSLAFACFLAACAGDPPAPQYAQVPHAGRADADAAPGANMDSILDYARRRNPEYAMMRREADAAEARAEAAGSLADPKLRIELQDFNSPALHSMAARLIFQWMQELPWFGKRDLQREIATLEATGARGRARIALADMEARIKSIYAQYYVIHQNEPLTRKIAELAAAMERLARSRHASGQASLSDVLQAQSEAASMQTELIALENDKRMLQSRLNMLLSRAPDAPLAEPVALRTLPPPSKLDHDALTERLRIRSPLIAAEEARVKAAEKSRDLTYKNRYPDFAIGVAPGVDGRQIKTVDTMIEFNVPIQQGTRRAQERESEAMLAVAKLRRKTVWNRAVSELAENLTGLDAARRTEAVIAERILPQAELNYRITLAGYANGTAGFATLLEAQRRIRSARLDQLKAQVDAQTRFAEIERLLGEEI